MSVTRFARLAYPWIAWLFLACVVVQFFLAGMGVFAGSENFATHRDFGYTFELLLLPLLLAAIVGRYWGRGLGAVVLLIVLFTLQSVFVGLRDSMPAVAALHPLNGVAIFTVTLWTARASMHWVDAPPRASASPSEPSRSASSGPAA